MADSTGAQAVLDATSKTGMAGRRLDARGPAPYSEDAPPALAPVGENCIIAC